MTLIVTKENIPISKSITNVKFYTYGKKDINFYPDKCRALLQRFIKNHGNLRNYHSFNYSFKNGTLRLNRKIIQPYFITENP